MSAFANTLRESMKRRGWDQKDLVAESGIPKATVSRWLSGEVTEPGLSNLIKASDALDIPLWKLIEAAGFPIEAPTSPEQQYRRLVTLAESLPWLSPVVEEIAGLKPEDVESVLTYLEVLRKRRRSPEAD